MIYISNSDELSNRKVREGIRGIIDDRKNNRSSWEMLSLLDEIYMKRIQEEYKIKRYIFIWVTMNIILIKTRDK